MCLMIVECVHVTAGVHHVLTYLFLQEDVVLRYFFRDNIFLFDSILVIAIQWQIGQIKPRKEKLVFFMSNLVIELLTYFS